MRRGEKRDMPGARSQVDISQLDTEKARKYEKAKCFKAKSLIKRNGLV